MINQIIFQKIKFNNLNYKKFEKLIARKGLFVFPSGPALASIKKSTYYKSGLPTVMKKIVEIAV